VPSISVLGSDACALLPDGTVKCWGDNSAGELGIGATTGPQTCEEDYEGDGIWQYPCSTSPVAVPGLSGVTAISGTCALLSDGTVRCWGDNSFGELGDGTSTGPEMCSYTGTMAPTTPCSTTPVAVSGLSGVTAISAGGSQVCALLSDGTVRCWGDNYYAELGNGTSTGPETCQSGWPCSTTPVVVSGLSGVVAISAGNDETCALLAGGTVQCWGAVEVLPRGSDSCQNGACATTPVAVPGLNGEVTAISGTCALMSGGTVECWSQCDGTPCSTVPVAIPGLSGVTAISGSCALISDGNVKCWGDSLQIAVEDGGPFSTVESGLRCAVSVSAGGSSGCAVISDGTVECWGNNGSGQLGDGTSSGPDDECLVGAACAGTAVVVVGL
jgi:alpha-tubulin suppressor-like RCC1 family protein